MLVLSWYFLIFVTSFYLIDLVHGWPILIDFFVGMFDVGNPDYLAMNVLRKP